MRNAIKLWIALGLLCICTASHPQNLDIHSMVVGNKALQLVETNPLTAKDDGDANSAWISPNGRWVVYSTSKGDWKEDGGDYQETSFLVSTDGGAPIRLSVPPDKHLQPGVTEEWLINGPAAIYGLIHTYSIWSPDSRLLAVEGMRVIKRAKPAGKPNANQNTADEDDSTCDQYYLIFDTRGRLYKALPFPAGLGPPMGSVVWSRDCRRFAAKLLDMSSIHVPPADGAPAEEPPEADETIAIFNVADGSVQPTKLKDVGFSDYLLGWGVGGGSLLYSTVVSDSGGRALREHPLDGTPDRTLISDISPNASPDFQKQIVRSETGVTVQKTATGEKTELIKNEKLGRCSWTPDGRFILCQRGRDLKDLSGGRMERVSELWLVSATETHALNHLCISPAASFMSSRSVSNDCLRVAYTSEGRLYVARLKWRDPTPWEKLAAGLELSESDSKQILQDRGDTIGILYKDATGESPDGTPPTFDELKSAAKEFLGSSATPEDAAAYFEKPGGHGEVFTYEPPEGKIDNAETTIIGYLDAGYSWRVNIYADGTAKVEEKKENRNEGLAQSYARGFRGSRLLFRR